MGCFPSQLKTRSRLETQHFLARLALLALVGRPRFGLMTESSGLTVGLAIGGTVSEDEVALYLSQCSGFKSKVPKIVLPLIPILELALNRNLLVRKLKINR